VVIFTSIITYNNRYSVRDATRVVSRRLLHADGRFQTNGTPYGIIGRLSGPGRGFPLPVPLFSPVSVIPPILYTQSFIYHQNYVTLPTDSVIKWHTDRAKPLNETYCPPAATSSVGSMNSYMQTRPAAGTLSTTRLHSNIPTAILQHNAANLFQLPNLNSSTRGCRVCWYKQLENTNHSVLSIKKTKKSSMWDSRIILCS
jgi:hypothetical protein